ncbi:TPA: hypothetical protein N3Z72_005200 [Salmonella enterica subsp. enterica serovar 6,14:y:1,7]|nr:hypothetical protein [Salmonella enterica subsp. enterica serovar 6,14:y:1,7]
MTPSSIPQKLWHPAEKVKHYVEKMPNGVTLTELHRKVHSYNTLSRSEKVKLIKFRVERESILEIKARNKNNPSVFTILRHKKYGYPQSNEIYTLIKDEKTKVCSKCGKEKPKTEFHINNTRKDGHQSWCKECTGVTTSERLWKKGENYGKRINNAQFTVKEEISMPEQITSVTAAPDSPEALRKQAEQLLKAAEEAEQKLQANTFISSVLSPVRLEIYQAAEKMQQKLDEFIDCMDDLNKAINKLNDMTVTE